MASKKVQTLKKNFWRRFFSVLGPGLSTGAADDDPSGIATCSIVPPLRLTIEARDRFGGHSKILADDKLAQGDREPLTR